MVHGFRLVAIPAWGRQWENLVLKDTSAERADTLVELALLLEGCRGRHWPRWRGLSRSCLSGARSWHTDAGVRAGVGGAGIGAGVGTGRLCANWTLDTGLSGARSWSWFGCHGRLFESHTQPRFRIMVLLEYRQGFHKSRDGYLDAQCQVDAWSALIKAYPTELVEYNRDWHLHMGQGICDHLSQARQASQTWV